MTINTVPNNSRKQKDQRRLPGNWHGRGKLVSVSVQSDVAAQGFQLSFRRYRLDSCQYITDTVNESRSQWPRGLRRGSVAARLLALWVRILPGAWTFVCCECCVLSGRSLCVGLITSLEESLPTVVRRCA